MLMRRLAERLRSHDWFSATIDFALVSAGVFLGIEAANWNEARQNEAEERRYYAQIIDDLRTDLNTLRTAEQRSILHDRAAEQTLAALQSAVPQAIPPGRIAAQIHYAGFLYLPRPARRTYDELISTGNLGLLRNARAKASIADYYAQFESDRQWDDLLRRQQSDYWQASAGVVPRPVLRDVIRGREPVLSAGQGAAIIAEARRRPRLADLLIGMAAHQERVRRDSEEQAGRAEALVRLLTPLAR